MEKILIVTPSFRHGGTNRSLWNWLNTQALTNCTVDILAMEHEGPYQEPFSRFSVLPKIGLLEATFSMNGSGLAKLRRIFWKMIAKVFFQGSRAKIFAYLGRHLDFRGYDMVVAFEEGLSTAFVSHLKVPRKIAWVRCDYSNYRRLTGKYEENLYGKFDKIVCVSEYTAQVFREIYPNLAQRVCAIHNIINAQGIMDSGKLPPEDTRFDTRGFTLVSVGRIDGVKRFDQIPEIVAQLEREGCDCKWYIIGDGEETEKVSGEIARHHMEKRVIMLGAKKNPYPYIARADLVVCPSYTEACPNVVNEAKILHIPVMAADFPSASEYIENGKDGWIVPIDEMASVISRLYRDKEAYGAVQREIANFFYDNDTVRKKLNALFQEGKSKDL